MSYFHEMPEYEGKVILSLPPWLLHTPLDKVHRAHRGATICSERIGRGGGLTTNPICKSSPVEN